MPSEGEVQLRERLSRLRSLPLLRGARLSGELERLQRQLEKIVAEPSGAASPSARRTFTRAGFAD